VVNWDIALRSRRDQTQNGRNPYLPLEFYDETTPDALLDELLEGLKTHLDLPRNRRAADSQALSGAGHFCNHLVYRVAHRLTISGFVPVYPQL